MGTGVAFFPPLGISVLTSFLREHHVSVKQDDLYIKTFHQNLKKKKKIDLRIFLDEKKINDFIKTGHEPLLEAEAEKIIKLTNCKGFDVIGLSLTVTDNPSTSAMGMVIAKILKEKFGSTIIAGGPLGTSIKEKLVKSGFIDYAIHGNSRTSIAEINILNFCNMFEKGIENQKIPGAIYMRDGKIMNNWPDYKKEEKFMVTTPCFDDLPMDLYKLKMIVNANKEEFRKKILVLPYFFVKGCPHRCSFCMLSLEEPFWTAKEPEDVVATLKQFSKKYKTKYFCFLNPTITPTYKYADRLADEMIKDDLNIFWTDCANFSLVDRTLLEKLKSAGALRLVFGLEMASPHVMKYIGKNFSLAHIEKTLKITHELNIWTEIDMICGFPYENEHDIQLTIDFLNRNQKFIDGVHLNKFWLDGNFMLYPEKYGINTWNDEKNFYHNWSTKPFDEINGLPWEEKIKQTEIFFTRLKDAINERDFIKLDAHELFLLFSIGKLRRDVALSNYKPQVSRSN